MKRAWITDYCSLPTSMYSKLQEGILYDSSGNTNKEKEKEFNKALYLMQTIFNSYDRDDVPYNEYLELPHNYFQKVITTTYSKLIVKLLDLEIIERNDCYSSTANQCYKYRIPDEHLVGDFKIYEYKITLRENNKYSKSINTNFFKSKNDVYRKLKNNIKKISLTDGESIDSIIEKESPGIIKDIENRIDPIKKTYKNKEGKIIPIKGDPQEFLNSKLKTTLANHEMYLKKLLFCDLVSSRNTTNYRLDYVLTQLSKRYRKYLRFGSKRYKLLELDMNNSQFVDFANLIYSILFKHQISKFQIERDEYSNLHQIKILEKSIKLSIDYLIENKIIPSIDEFLNEANTNEKVELLKYKIKDISYKVLYALVIENIEYFKDYNVSSDIYNSNIYYYNSDYKYINTNYTYNNINNTYNTDITPIMSYVNGIFSSFLYVSTSGTLYEDIETKVGYKSRNDAKDNAFKIIFDIVTHEKFSVDQRLFETTYPLITMITKIFKIVLAQIENEKCDAIGYDNYLKRNKDKSPEKVGSSQLPILLQNIESFIFIDELLTLLLNNNFHVFPIHDSFLIPENEYKRAKKLIEGKLSKLLPYGFHLKEKPLN